ncbi:uncharacterized protein LOC124153477 [Ischnura elegans]|uniref:uncharacterized protein LOC124153477 n=1 Tax=Ischnura elegans TaxID=197161 RepID=UPI001ED86962|nr:uncharacterized protein LOC124153477 [Ischnura elegans]
MTEFRTMRTLALAFLFSLAANAQYITQAEKGVKVKQSRLSEMSPRAGPDRPKAVSVPLSVLTPLTALGGLGRHVTISPSAQKASPYIQPQILGLGTGQIEPQVYSLSHTGAPYLQSQKPRIKGGYAVQEPSQEDSPEPTTKGYQFGLEKLPSEKRNSLEAQQYQNPLVIQQYQATQEQDSLPVTIYSSPQQHSQRNQIVYPAPITYYQANKHPTQEFSPQQQLYDEKVNTQYIQTGSPIVSTTASPPTTIHLTSVNSPSYSSSTEAVFPDSNKQNQEQIIYKDGVAYEVVNPLNYRQPAAYYSFALDDSHRSSAQGGFEPVSTDLYQNQVPQTTTEKSFLPISRGYPVDYNPQISTVQSENAGVSRGIYDSNAPILAIGPQGRDRVAEPEGIFTYIQQPFLGAASSGDTNYNGNQGNFLRNPIEYASPFARQELLELRQKKGFS